MTGHMRTSSAAHDSESGSSLRSYILGFALSAILTAISFRLVMGGTLVSNQVTGLLLMVLAAIQIVVHMVCFLHMDFRSDDGWTMMALIFTAILVAITLIGSIWVMYHLNVNMMPGDALGSMP
jgi:cytochrome o ubiquinol oxidase operon protein cyoD